MQFGLEQKNRLTYCIAIYPCTALLAEYDLYISYHVLYCIQYVIHMLYGTFGRNGFKVVSFRTTWRHHDSFWLRILWRELRAPQILSSSCLVVICVPKWRCWYTTHQPPGVFVKGSWQPRDLFDVKSKTWEIWNSPGLVANGRSWQTTFWPENNLSCFQAVSGDHWCQLWRMPTDKLRRFVPKIGFGLIWSLS